MTSRPFATPLHQTLGQPLHTKLPSLECPPAPRPFATPLARKLHQPLTRPLHHRPGVSTD